MPTLDLEAEYNNRQRVPEHPQISARWSAGSAAYRQTAKADLDQPYGPKERHRYDLFRAGDAKAPLAVYIHGGYWQRGDRKDYSFVAQALNAAGIDVALPSYSLCPAVSVMDIVAELRLCLAAVWQKTKKHPVVTGHSAGGHLTAAMVASDWSKVAGVPADLVRAGVAISGVFDLAPLIPTSINDLVRFDDAVGARRQPPVVAAAAQGPHAGGGRRRRRKLGVPAAEPGDRGGLGAGRPEDGMPGRARHRPFHCGRRADKAHEPTVYERRNPCAAGIRRLNSARAPRRLSIDHPAAMMSSSRAMSSGRDSRCSPSGTAATRVQSPERMRHQVERVLPRHVRVLQAVQDVHGAAGIERRVADQVAPAVLDQRARDGIGPVLVARGAQVDALLLDLPARGGRQVRSTSARSCPRPARSAPAP